MVNRVESPPLVIGAVVRIIDRNVGGALLPKAVRGAERLEGMSQQMIAQKLQAHCFITLATRWWLASNRRLR